MNRYYNAMESFLDAEQTVSDLLNNVKANVDKKITTVDDACALEYKLSEEAAKFNECLTHMSNAIRMCEQGNMSREQMLAECAPCVAELKNKCVALSLSDANIIGTDITENEIAMLRQFIVGCKDIVAAKKVELQDSGECSCESFLPDDIGYLEPASEGSQERKIAFQIMHGTEKKTGDQFVKQARKLFKSGAKDEALQYLTKARAVYQKLLDEAKKYAKMKNAKRVNLVSMGVGLKADLVDQEVTNSISLAGVISSLEKRLAACDVLELKFKNKSTKGEYKQLKNQLKSERKAAKNGYYGGNEAMTNYDEMVLESWVASMESYLDDLELNLAIEAAMEASGEDKGSEKSPSKIGSRLRAGFAKLRKGKQEGDNAAIAQASREIDAAAADLEEATAEAEATGDEQKKSRLLTAAKVGLGAAGVAAAGVGAYKLAKTMKDKSQGGKFSLKSVSGLIKQGKAKVIQTKTDAAIKLDQRKKQRKATRDMKEYEKGNKALQKALQKMEKNNPSTGVGTVNEAFAALLEEYMHASESMDDFDDIDEMEGRAFDDFDDVDYDDARESAIRELAFEALINRRRNANAYGTVADLL